MVVILNRIGVRAGMNHKLNTVSYAWSILLKTNLSIHTKWLKSGMKPEGVFELVDGEWALSTYEFCNLHGLWMTEV